VRVLFGTDLGWAMGLLITTTKPSYP